MAKTPVKKESAKKPEAAVDKKKYKTFNDRFEKSEVPMCSNKHVMKLLVVGRPPGIICDVCGVKID